VPIIRIDHQLKVLVGTLERVHQLQRVLHMNIIVPNAVDEEQTPVQLGRRFNHGRAFVSLGIFLRRVHVAFCVKRIVIVPIGDGCASDASGEKFAVR
jgi:hypothetical protein